MKKEFCIKTDFWQSEIKYFCDCILNDKKVLNGNSEDALKIMLLLENIYEDSKMDENKFINDYFRKCATYLNDINVIDEIIQIKNLILQTKEIGGKLIFAGNGASASIANHASLDFTKQGKVKSVNFNESAFITAFSNDYGYEGIGLKAFQFYGDKGDTAILISSSGSSKNIVNAAIYAKDNGINVITFTGFDEDNPLKSNW